jgi:hypothetical protein
MRNFMMAAAMAFGAASLSVPAVSQVSVQPGLVNVTIQDVSILNGFLNHDQIAALNNVSVPVTVQAPIGVAANVCGVSAAVLGKAGSAAACDAKSGSKALAQVVNRQLLSQKKK